MLTKYNNDILSPYFNLFNFDHFRFADDVYGTTRNLRSTGYSYRVVTTDTGLELSLDLPGVKSKDLSVQATGRTVTVSGKLRGEDFKTSYRVSKDYDLETATAALEDGVLTLSFEKSAAVQPRTIDIQAK